MGGVPNDALGVGPTANEMPLLREQCRLGGVLVTKLAIPADVRRVFGLTAMEQEVMESYDISRIKLY